MFSGIGKGVTTAAIAKLFQFRGYKVSIVKIDPYLNIDPGTMNPQEHGECFVTENVWCYKPVEAVNQEFCIAEIDQDFGTYERFLGKNIHPSHNITSGQVFIDVILKERHGKYLGKTVQLIPHVTDVIRNRLQKIATEECLDVLLIECGGTVGDLEGMVFLEAFRQMRLELVGETCLVHVTMVPYNESVGELKTKPTQHSVRQLQAAGLQPDVLVCRSTIHLDEASKKKISLFCNVPQERVISNPDVGTVYEVPLIFESQMLGDSMCNLLRFQPKLVEYSPVENYSEWKKLVDKYKACHDVVINIAMPGKYTRIKDSYVSINEALKHAGAMNNARVNITWLDSESEHVLDDIERFDGILLTPGFGSRGVEDMIGAADAAIVKKIPYLGICFGSQLMFIAFCRRFLNLKHANSTELEPGTTYPVVSMMDAQKSIEMLGGTMRLGAHEVHIKDGTRVRQAYKQPVVHERFRHRYHISNEYARQCAEHGLVVSSTDKAGEIINSIELDSADHFCVGVQFHPEYKSRPWAPAPLYDAFVNACIAFKRSKA